MSWFFVWVFFFYIKKHRKPLSWLMRKLRAFIEERINLSGPPRRLQRRESVRANVLQEEVHSDKVSPVEKLSPKVLE